MRAVRLTCAALLLSLLSAVTHATITGELRAPLTVVAGSTFDVHLVLTSDTGDLVGGLDFTVATVNATLSDVTWRGTDGAMTPSLFDAFLFGSFGSADVGSFLPIIDDADTTATPFAPDTYGFLSFGPAFLLPGEEALVATLELIAGAPGLAILDLSLNSLSDGVFGAAPINIPLAEIQVTDPVVGMPLPGGIALLLIAGLVGLRVRR